MRAIPFRHVFVAGLNEGDFPSGERRDVLDLRGARRRAGDVSPREQDRYMFLEALLSARDSLTLSYVRRDALTGERLSPSSVVAELKQMLQPGYVDSFQRLVLEPPLRRWEDDPDAVLPPEAGRERQAKRLRDSLREAAGPGVPVPPLDEIRRALSPAERAKVDALLGVLEVPPRPSSGSVKRVELSLSQLRRFLECPLQGSAGARLGLRESGEEGAVDVEDEPFESAPAERTLLLREAFVEALRHPAAPGEVPSDDDLAAARTASARRREDEGRIPTGLFGAAEEERDRKVLRLFRDGLLAACGGAPPRPRVVRFGRAVEGAVAEEVHPPLDLGETPLADGRLVEVTLHGETSPLVTTINGTASLHVAARSNADADPGEREDKDALRGWIDLLALSAAGLGGPSGHRFLVARSRRGGDEGRADELPLPAVPPDEALSRLRSLAAEMLGRTHDYLLPCEAVSRHRRKGTDIDEAVEELVDGERSKFSSDYGPVPAARSLYRPPEAAEAAAMVRERFGPFFDGKWVRS